MPIILDDCSGGVNVYDSPTELPTDQVVVAQNVLWSTANVAVRRLGMEAYGFWNDFGGARAVLNMQRVLVSGEAASAQLFFNIVASGGAAYGFRSADTAFHELTPVDAATLVSNPRFVTAAAHQKCHVAYRSAVDRMHVQAGIGDPSTTNFTVRRAGLPEPTAITSATPAGAGSLNGTRYYRYRYIYSSGGTIWRRSEPSVSISATPVSDASVDLVFPALPSGETISDIEIEASDDDADFYRIATQVSSDLTYSDTTVDPLSYATDGVLSEDIGDYIPTWSAKFAVVDEDRLVIAGSHFDIDLQSRVGWTPVYGEPGVGNDERIPINPTSYEDLNAGNGGQITNMVGPINNIIYVSKDEHLYKIVRTNNRSRAYIVVPISKTIGAIEGSMVEGTDETGAACVYFLDQKLGAHRLGQFGLQYVGQDVFPLWSTANLNAGVPVGAFYYPTEGQVIWSYATGSAAVPSACFVFNVEHGQTTPSGDVRKGWSVYTGLFDQFFMCGVMYAADLLAGTRSAALVPFFGFYGESGTSNINTLQQGETGNDDNGETYRAYIVTRPYVAGQTTLQKTEVKAGQIVVPPASGVSLAFRAWADFGKEVSSVVTVDLTADARELSQNVSRILRFMDNLSLADCRTTQIEFGDPDTDGNDFWQLDRADLSLVRNENMGGGG